MMIILFFVLIVIYAIHIATLKGTMKGKVELAFKKGKTQGGIGILISDEMLADPHTRFTLEQAKAENISTTFQQLKFIQNQNGTPDFFIGTLFELQSDINRLMPSGKWKLYLVK